MKGSVVLIIVEGISDEETLVPWINRTINKLKKRVTPIVIHGDMLTRYKKYSKEFEITSSNVTKELQKVVNSFLKKPSNVIKWVDIIKVYYVTDTDNCFKIEKENLINKRKCLNKLFKLKKIGKSKDSRQQPFEVIFFGNNLEHVLYGIENKLSDKEKTKLSTEFAIDVSNGKKDFKSSFSQSEIKTWNIYEESYKEIQNYKGRATNITALIEEIENGFKLL